MAEKAGKGFDLPRLRELDQEFAASTPEFFRAAPTGGNPSDAPVFVVGIRAPALPWQNKSWLAIQM